MRVFPGFLLKKKTYFLVSCETHCKQKPLSDSGDHAPTVCLTLGQSKTRTILNVMLAYSKTCKKRTFLPTNSLRRTLKLRSKIPLKVTAAKLIQSGKLQFSKPDFTIFTDDLMLLSRLTLKNGAEFVYPGAYCKENSITKSKRNPR